MKPAIAALITLFAAPAFAEPPQFVTGVPYSADHEQLTADMLRRLEKECGGRADFAHGANGGFTNPKAARAACIDGLKLSGKPTAEVEAAFKAAIAIMRAKSPA